MSTLKETLASEEFKSLSPAKKIDKAFDLFKTQVESNEEFLNDYISRDEEGKQEAYDQFKQSLFDNYKDEFSYKVIEDTSGRGKTKKRLPIYDYKTETFLESINEGVVDPSELKGATGAYVYKIARERDLPFTKQVENTLRTELKEEYGVDDSTFNTIVEGAIPRMGSRKEDLEFNINYDKDALKSPFKSEWEKNQIRKNLELKEKQLANFEKVEGIRDALDPSRDTKETIGAVLGNVVIGAGTSMKLSKLGFDIIGKNAFQQGAKQAAKQAAKGIAAQGSVEFALGSLYAGKLPATETSAKVVNFLFDTDVESDNPILTGLEAMAIGTTVGGIIEGVSAIRFAKKVKAVKSPQEFRELLVSEFGEEGAKEVEQSMKSMAKGEDEVPAEQVLKEEVDEADEIADEDILTEPEQAIEPEQVTPEAPVAKEVETVQEITPDTVDDVVKAEPTAQEPTIQEPTTVEPTPTTTEPTVKGEVEEVKVDDSIKGEENQNKLIELASKDEGDGFVTRENGKRIRVSTENGVKVGDKYDPGLKVKPGRFKDESTFPEEYTVDYIDQVLAGNGVNVTTRNMTPDEVAKKQEKIAKENELALELGLPQKEIIESPYSKEVSTQEPSTPTVTDVSKAESEDVVIPELGKPITREDLTFQAKEGDDFLGRPVTGDILKGDALQLKPGQEYRYEVPNERTRILKVGDDGRLTDENGAKWGRQFLLTTDGSSITLIKESADSPAQQAVAKQPAPQALTPAPTAPLKQASDQLDEVVEEVKSPEVLNEIQSQQGSIKKAIDTAEQEAQVPAKEKPAPESIKQNSSPSVKSISADADEAVSKLDEMTEEEKFIASENVPIEDAEKVFNPRYLRSLDAETRGLVIAKTRELIGANGIDKLNGKLTREQVVQMANEIGIEDAENIVNKKLKSGVDTPAAMIVMRNTVDAIGERIVDLERQIKVAVADGNQELAESLSATIDALSRRQERMIGDMLNVRTAAGRELAHFRWYTYRFDDIQYLVSQAKKQLGLPPGVDLPDDVMQTLRDRQRELREAKSKSVDDVIKNMAAKFNLPSLSKSREEVTNLITESQSGEITKGGSKSRSHKLSDAEKKVKKVSKAINKKKEDIDAEVVTNAIENLIKKGTANTLTKRYRDSVVNSFLSKFRDGKSMPANIKRLYDTILEQLNNQVRAERGAPLPKELSINKIGDILANPEKNEAVINNIRIKIENLDVDPEVRENIRNALDFLSGGNIDPTLLRKAIGEEITSLRDATKQNILSLIKDGDDDLIINEISEKLPARIGLSGDDAIEFTKQLQSEYSNYIEELRLKDLTKKAKTQKTTENYKATTELIAKATDQTKKKLVRKDVKEAIKEVTASIDSTLVKELNEGKYLELTSDVLTYLKRKTGLEPSDFAEYENAVRLELKDIVDRYRSKKAQMLKDRLEKSIKTNTDALNKKIQKEALRQGAIEGSSEITEKYRKSLVSSITSRLKDTASQSPALKQLFDGIRQNMSIVGQQAVKEKPAQLDPALAIADIINNADENIDMLLRTRDSILSNPNIKSEVKGEAIAMIDVLLKKPISEDIVNKFVKNELKEAFENTETSFIKELKEGRAGETLDQLKESFASKTGLTGDKLSNANELIDNAFKRLLLEERNKFIKNALRDNKLIGAKLKKTWLDKLEELERLGVLNDPRAKDVLEKVFKLDPDQSKELQLLIENSPDLATAHNNVREYLRLLNATSLFEAVGILRKASLLWSPATHIKNLFGTGFNFALEEWNRLPSSIADALFSKFTGRRTIYTNYTTLYQDIKSGALQGWNEARNILKGLDPADLSKFDVAGEVYLKSFGDGTLAKGANKVGDMVSAYINYNFRLLASEDRVFRVMAIKRALRYIGEIKYKKQGLKGKELEDSIEGFIHNPDPEAMAQAIYEAELITFNNKNMATDTLSNLIKRGYKHDEAWVNAISAIADNLVPFKRTPVNVLLRLASYVPGLSQTGSFITYLKLRSKAKGLPRELEEEILAKAQKTLAESVGRGTTGMGLIVLGNYLYNEGLLTPPYDHRDRALNNTLTAAGRNNSELMGVPIGGVGPVTDLMLLGASMSREKQRIIDPEEKGGWFEEALRVYANPVNASVVLENPFYSGFQDFVKLSEGSGSGTARFVSNFISSYIPGISRDIANVIDPTQVRAESGEKEFFSELLELTKEATFAKIPLLKSTVPARDDVIGREQKLASMASVFIPALKKWADVNEIPVLNDLIDLQVGIPKAKRKENEPDDIYGMRKAALGLIQIAVADQIINTENPKFKEQFESLTDFQKQKVIKQGFSKARNDVNSFFNEMEKAKDWDELKSEEFARGFFEDGIEKNIKISQDITGSKMESTKSLLQELKAESPNPIIQRTVGNLSNISE